MRKILVAGGLTVVVAAASGWWAYSHLDRNRLGDAALLMDKGDVRAAQLILRTLVQNEPGNAEAHFRLGQAHLQLGNAIAAEKELRAARSGGVKAPELVPTLAQAVLEQNRPLEVLREFAPADLPAPQLSALDVVRGTAFLAVGNVAAAQASADSAMALAPDAAGPRMLAARVARARGEIELALSQLDGALKRQPTLLQALLMKADLLRQASRFNEALAPLDAAVAASPDSMEARLDRAGVYLDLNDDAKASADVDAVLAKQAKNPLALYSRALIQIRAKNWTAADQTLQSISFVLPQLQRGDYFLAMAKANLNQDQQALDAIDRYTARVPSDPDGWRLRARIDIAAGRKPEAEKDFAKLIAAKRSSLANDAAPAGSDPATASSQSLTELASLQLNQGNASAAAHDLDLSLQAAPPPAQVAAGDVLRALRQADVDSADAALERLRRAPGAQPAVIGALTAAVRLGQLRIDEARAALEDAQKAAPDALPIQVDLARLMMLQRQYDQADALMQPLLARDPANPLLLNTYLRMAIISGQPNKAQAALKAALAARPNNAGLTLALANLLAQQGNYPDAYAALDALDPDAAQTPGVRLGRARLLVAQGHVKEAVAIFQGLLKEAPDNPALRRQTLLLLMQDREWDAAAQMARDMLKVAPGDLNLMALLIDATRSAKGLDAALHVAEELRTDPANLPAARMLKGAAYAADGKPADAVAAFTAEAAQSPFSALVVAQATAMRSAGQADAAIKVLTEWVARMPDPNAANLLGSIAIEQHHYDDAIAQFKLVVALRPTDALALNNLAWLYQQQKNPEALALARKAYIIAPTGQTADTLGWILTTRGESRVGAMLLAEAAQDVPKDPSVQYHYAVALKDLGDRSKAAAAVAAAVASPVKFEELEAAHQLQQDLAADSAPK